MKTIIGIDPGAGGGIAFHSKGVTKVVNMPDTVTKMKEYLQYIIDTYDTPIVFIEKVQAYGGGDDIPGKKFGINKMLANYEQLKATIELSGIIYVEVHPSTWQSVLGFREKRPKNIDLGKWKTIRKRKYKEYAQKHFPQLKVTLKTSDALCMIAFALNKFENDFDWILKNCKKQHATKFFGK